MELDPATTSRVWWKGALGGALKGIPQGILLGVLGFAILTVGIYAVGATSMVASFGPFLFSDAAAAATAVSAGSFSSFLSTFSPATFIALNTTLTVVGNFLTGGKIAVTAHKQDVEHRMNDARITAIESREQMLEQCVTPSRAVQKILAQGPRLKHGFEAAEQERESSVPEGHTIH